MIRTRSHFVCFCLACFLAAALYGQSVAPVSDQASELKTTAHGLRISVVRLADAREALKQATDLARHSTDPQTFSQIAQNWTRIDRTKAPDALEDLYGWLKTTARDASDVKTYGRCADAAVLMLQELASLDSDKAMNLWRMWPDPPAALGASGTSAREQASAQFEKQLAAANQGPGTGSDLTILSQQAAKGDYRAAGTLVTQLYQYGNRAEALKVVDQAAANFRQGSQDPQSISNYYQFIRQLPNVDTDRYLVAMNTLVASLNNAAHPGAGGSLTVGDQKMPLSPAEGFVINMCQSLYGHPDLAIKTLDIVPGLKSKLDAVGGIDEIVGPLGSPYKSPISMMYSIDGQREITLTTPAGDFYKGANPGASGPSFDPGNLRASATALYQNLRYKLAKDPAYVKQMLSNAAKTPDQVDVLVNVANSAWSTDPDLASLALDLASKMVMQVEPLSKRATVMQSLIQGYQHCNGEVDAGLMQKAISVVRQLRDEQNHATAPVPSARGLTGGKTTAADQLEAVIVAELALDDFPGAIKYVSPMSDEQKLEALLRIVLTLTSSSY